MHDDEVRTIDYRKSRQALNATTHAQVKAVAIGVLAPKLRDPSNAEAQLVAKLKWPEDRADAMSRSPAGRGAATAAQTSAASLAEASI